MHGNAAIDPDEREHGELPPDVRKAVEERVTASPDQEEDDEDSNRHRVSHDVLSSLPGPSADVHGTHRGEALGGTPSVVERSIHIRGRHKDNPPDARGRDDRDHPDKAAAVRRRQRPDSPHGHAGPHREEREHGNQCQMIGNQGYAINRASAAAGGRVSEVRRGGDARHPARRDQREPSRRRGAAGGGAAGAARRGQCHGPPPPTSRPAP